MTVLRTAPYGPGILAPILLSLMSPSLGAPSLRPPRSPLQVIPLDGLLVDSCLSKALLLLAPPLLPYFPRFFFPPNIFFLPRLERNQAFTFQNPIVQPLPRPLHVFDLPPVPFFLKTFLSGEFFFIGLSALSCLTTFSLLQQTQVAMLLYASYFLLS